MNEEEETGERSTRYFLAGFLALITGFVVLTLGVLSDNSSVSGTGAGVICIAAIIQSGFFLSQNHARTKMNSFSSKEKNRNPIVYEDRLVSITNESITFFSYTFPLCRRRRVLFEEIDHIIMSDPTLLTGKWRIWGSGDLHTWFPLDIRRPYRDRIFVATLKTKWFRIGFSVEDSTKVADFFQMHNLLYPKDKERSKNI